MPKFREGNSGKKRGTADHSWARISFWMERINKEWEHLTPNQRAHYSVELSKLLISKLKALPSDPNESVDNVDEALKTLRELETKTADIKPDIPA